MWILHMCPVPICALCELSRLRHVSRRAAHTNDNNIDYDDNNYGHFVIILAHQVETQMS